MYFNNFFSVLKCANFKVLNTLSISFLFEDVNFSTKKIIKF